MQDKLKRENSKGNF